MAEMVSGFNREFGDRHKRIREERGLSLSALARLMNETGWESYRATTVSRTESGERAVRLDEAVTLARVLGTTVDALAGMDNTQAALEFELGRRGSGLASAANEVEHRLMALFDAAENAFHGLSSARKVTNPGASFRATRDGLSELLGEHRVDVTVPVALDAWVRRNGGALPDTLRWIADGVKSPEMEQLMVNLKRLATIAEESATANGDDPQKYIVRWYESASLNLPDWSEFERHHKEQCGHER